MKTNFLFPNKFRIIGWTLLIPGIILGFMVIFNGFELPFLDIKALSLLPNPFGIPGLNLTEHQLYEIVDTNFTDELAGLLFILGGVFVAFSKEKNEDEYIAKIRLESLLWATYVTYAIQIFCILFFFDFTFLKAVMINTFASLLIVFIIRYNFIIYRSKLQLHNNNEE
ncbi:hypothetical protein M2138_001977 [Dysgonomonadaceae bacterium PH5-43]|nr:hypothetical protein [Dysgonomonadaceae bacterium PH5-43]